MKKTLVRVIAAGVMTLAFGAAADARPFTAKDLATLDRLSDPRISPDGRYVIYARRVADYDANKATTELWLVDLNEKTPAPVRLAASDGGVSSARWAADGRSIYFMSARGGSNQVWLMDMAGKAASKVTDLPFDVGSFRTSADGKTLLVSLSVFPDCATLECTKTRKDAKPIAAGDKANGVVFDKIFIRHWDEWADGTRNQLFALDLDPKGTASNPRPIMKGFDGDVPSKPFGDETDYSFAPDGKSVMFSARIAGKDEPWSTNFDVFKARLDGSAAPENHSEVNKAWDAQPTTSPDGKLGAWRAMKRPGFESDRFAINIADSSGPVFKTRELSPGWDRSADTIVWAPDSKTIYTTAEEIGQRKLFAVDVKTGKARALTDQGNVGGFDVSSKGVVYALDTLSSPAQMFYLPLKAGSKPVQLTSANADRLKGVELGAYEQFSFAGWNNETVRGYLVKPAGFDPSKRYPVAFLIHGGPQGSFGNLFHYRWNAQAYAGAGYAVVMIDFHGSTGYGQAFTDAISQHWGDRPLEDLQKGWAYALSKYSFLDGGRACALGGSYGGYMVNWIAGNWSGPWKCLVNHDGIFDARFMGYATEELWFTEWENGGTPWTPGATFEKFNPANFVQNWSKPELVIHGARDYRVPLEQGIATFTALQRKGIDSKLLYFPEENHWVLKPQNLVQWHDEVLGWLKKYAPVN
jgi:dipeptidyl aminopeptidase/acylaminoacyl peptidase